MISTLISSPRWLRLDGREQVGLELEINSSRPNKRDAFSSLDGNNPDPSKWAGPREVLGSPMAHLLAVATVGNEGRSCGGRAVV